MKSILISIALILSVSVANIQKFGVSFSYATAKVLAMYMFYVKNANRFHFGCGYQFNGQNKTVVKERKDNCCSSIQAGAHGVQYEGALPSITCCRIKSSAVFSYLSSFAFIHVC
jgi:hypothetical protein